MSAAGEHDVRHDRFHALAVPRVFRYHAIDRGYTYHLILFGFKRLNTVFGSAWGFYLPFTMDTKNFTMGDVK